MKHAAEEALARVAAAGFRALGWRGGLAAGARLGDAMFALGVRRRVAEANLALAFPERSAAERESILRAHYRELGRVVSEYPRLAELARRPAGEVVTVRGLEHIEAARGRGVILLSGHYGNFELLGAYLGRFNPIDFVVRSLSNPRTEALLAGWRAAAGVGRIDAGASVRRVYEAIKGGRWVAMLADQDARRHGAFVPFFGRPASTPIGPARIALALGCPLVMGFTERLEDGRHVLEMVPPLEVEEPRAPDAAVRLTALHAALLERRIREHPAQWFWLHRRWKSAPPGVERAA